MRATLDHFLSKTSLKRPGGPSSKVYPFPPSSDSSLPESLRVLNYMHLQLLGKPELSGIYGQAVPFAGAHLQQKTKS